MATPLTSARRTSELCAATCIVVILGITDARAGPGSAFVKGAKAGYNWIEELFLVEKAALKPATKESSVLRATEETAASRRRLFELKPSRFDSQTEDTSRLAVVARVATNKDDLNKLFSGRTTRELAARFPQLRNHWDALPLPTMSESMMPGPLVDDIALVLFRNEPQAYANLISTAARPPELTLGAFRKHIQGLVNRQLDRDLSSIDRYLTARTVGDQTGVTSWARPLESPASTVRHFLESLPESETARSNAAFPVINKWAVEQQSLRVVLRLGDVTAERTYNLANIAPALVGATAGSIASQKVMESVRGPDAGWARADPCAKDLDGSDRRIIGATSESCTSADEYIKGLAEARRKARIKGSPPFELTPSSSVE